MLVGIDAAFLFECVYKRVKLDRNDNGIHFIDRLIGGNKGKKKNVLSHLEEIFIRTSVVGN
jgi:hypothetical protein